jgi:hypothetical protein
MQLIFFFFLVYPSIFSIELVFDAVDSVQPGGARVAAEK